jgi:hypothetical protein
MVDLGKDGDKKRYCSSWDFFSTRTTAHEFALSQPGVDVMITIFCDFYPFLAKKWRFSQKPML